MSPALGSNSDTQCHLREVTVTTAGYNDREVAYTTSHQYASPVILINGYTQYKYLYHCIVPLVRYVDSVPMEQKVVVVETTLFLHCERASTLLLSTPLQCTMVKLFSWNVSTH